jgi:uncharacterized protein with ATP-grasp and redox domains
MSMLFEHLKDELNLPVFFDVFLIRELIKIGKEVIVSPESAPVINDATIEDLWEAGISSSEAG